MNKVEKSSKHNNQMSHEYYERKIKEINDTENVNFLKTLVKFKKKEENSKNNKNNKLVVNNEKKNSKNNQNLYSQSKGIFKTITSNNNNNFLNDFNSDINLYKKEFNEHTISSIDFYEEAISNSQFREFQNLDIQSNKGINYQEIFEKNKDLINKRKRKKIEQFNTKYTISKIDAIINETKNDEKKLLIRPFSQNTLNSKFCIFDYLLPTKSDYNSNNKKQKNDNMIKFKEKRKELIEKRKNKTYLDEAKAKTHSHIPSIDIKISRNINYNIYHPYENGFKPNSSLTKYPFRKNFYQNNYLSNYNYNLNKTENEKEFNKNSMKNIKKIEIIKQVNSNKKNNNNNGNKSLSYQKTNQNKCNRSNTIKSITLKLFY